MRGRFPSCFMLLQMTLKTMIARPHERGEYAQAIDDRAAAQEHTEEARTILCRAAASVPEQGPLRARYSNLQAFLRQVC